MLIFQATVLVMPLDGAWCGGLGLSTAMVLGWVSWVGISAPARRRGSGDR